MNGTATDGPVCKTKPNTLVIIIIVVIYYLLTIILWYFLGRPFIAFISFAPISIALLLLFGNTSCADIGTPGETALVNYAWIFFAASIIAAAVYLLFIIVYKKTKNRLTAFAVSMIFSFIATLLGWAIIVNFTSLPVG